MTKPKPVVLESWGGVLAQCDPEQLLTIEQTRGIFGVSRSTLDLWHQTRRPPLRVDINGLARYRVADILPMVRTSKPHGSIADTLAVGATAKDDRWPGFRGWLARLFGRQTKVSKVPKMVPVLLVLDSAGATEPVPLGESLGREVDDSAVLCEMTLAQLSTWSHAYMAARQK